MEFQTLGLALPLMRAVAEKGYDRATPIQIKAIPHVIEGRDLMGCAQTGTGKTAAFALPILHRFLDQIQQAQPADSPAIAPRQAHPEPRDVAPRGASTRGDRRSASRSTGRPIRALVLAPTRELAVQIRASFALYGKHTGMRSTVIYGGVGQGSQVRDLQRGVDILVATPGRLLDLMNQGYVHLGKVNVLVLDEADQMLDMGFIHDLKRIVATVPAGRQTLMFSATMSDEIRDLSRQWLNDPVLVEVVPVATPAERVTQAVFFVEQSDKPTLLTHFLRNHSCGRTLVFSRTKHGADKIVKRLLLDGIPAAAIHSNKSQSIRQKTLERFKSPRPPVLIATDIAARGLDVGGITHVINYDLPDVPELYVHRIGRTGRAGAEGIAYSFCSRDERGRLRMIERITRRPIPAGEPEGEAAALCQSPPSRRAADHESSDTEGSESRASGPSRRGQRSGNSPRASRSTKAPPRNKFGNKPGTKFRSGGKKRAAFGKSEPGAVSSRAGADDGSYSGPGGEATPTGGDGGATRHAQQRKFGHRKGKVGTPQAGAAPPKAATGPQPANKRKKRRFAAGHSRSSY